MKGKVNKDCLIYFRIIAKYYLSAQVSFTQWNINETFNDRNSDCRTTAHTKQTRSKLICPLIVFQTLVNLRSDTLQTFNHRRIYFIQNWTLYSVTRRLKIKWTTRRGENFRVCPSVDEQTTCRTCLNDCQQLLLPVVWNWNLSRPFSFVFYTRYFEWNRRRWL